MSEPLTEEEMEAMWKKDMERPIYKNGSPEFRALMSWMYDLESYKRVMRTAHLPNPRLQMIPKKEHQ